MSFDPRYDVPLKSYSLRPNPNSNTKSHKKKGPGTPSNNNKAKKRAAEGLRGNLGVVVLPDAAGDLVAPEVEGLELDPADAQLF